MLGKLLKYEFKATARTFIPVYIGILLIALINRIARVINIQSVFNITGMVLGALFVALGVLTIIVIVERFYKNLLMDEGYLMFTLPVKTESIIGSKLITGVIWGIISVIVAVIGGLILFADAEFLRAIREFIGLLKITPKAEIMHIIGICLIVGITMLVLYSCIILLVYLSLAIPQIAKISKHKIAASFISFFVLNTIITTISAKILGGELIQRLFREISLDNYLVSGIVSLYFIGVGLILFIGTNYILKKHLNLQ